MGGPQLVRETRPVERVAEEDEAAEGVLGGEQAGDPAAVALATDHHLAPVA